MGALGTGVRVMRWWWDLAAPHPRWWPVWPSLACNGSRAGSQSWQGGATCGSRHRARCRSRLAGHRQRRLPQVIAGVDVVVSTVPADAVAPYAPVLAATPLLLDAIYDPWPTPLASAVEAAGGRVISGLQMLLHQAFAQVEQFTGLPAPKEAMRAALF